MPTILRSLLDRSRICCRPRSARTWAPSPKSRRASLEASGRSPAALAAAHELGEAALEAGPGPAVDVQEHAAAGVVDRGQGRRHLGLEGQGIDHRVEGRHPAQDRAGRRRRVAAHQRQVLGVLDLGVVDHRPPRLAGRQPARPQRVLGPAPHDALALEAVGDQIGDRAQDQVVLGGEGLELGHPRHLAIVLHDLADHAGRLAPGQPRQIDRALGLPGAHQDAAAAGPQREDVAGRYQIVGPGVVGDRGPDRGRAILGRDPGRHPVAGLDRHRERGAQAGLVVAHHGR
jgi:hypothetical protein